MKFLKFAIVLVSFANFANAQDFKIPLQDFNNKRPTQQQQVHTDINTIRMSFALDALYGNAISQKDYGKFVDLYFGKGYTNAQIGEPKLPVFKRLIQIPNNAQVSVKINGFTQSEMALSDFGIENPIYPNQPSVRKDKDSNTLPFFFKELAYGNTPFLSEPKVSVTDLGTLRGVRIALLQVNPVQYNGATNRIKIFNNIDVEVIATGGSVETENAIRARTYSPYFDPIFNALANPYTKGVYEDHPDLTKYPVKMQIVSPREFEQTLQPFIQWKTQKGFTVDVAYTDQIGETAESIKSFIHGQYNTGLTEDVAPTFLVLVGDVDQMPASATGSESKRLTDLYYASVDGDQFPEMYYGRLSAETDEELENIISKIIYYEKYQFTNPTYLDNATFIAGVDATWNPKVGQPTVKYATQNYFNSANQFNTVWGYGVDNDPNNPNNSAGYSGCYDTERLSVSLINYTAHCSQTTWSDPELDANTIQDATSTGMYPLAIGNCCTSADFGYSYGVSIGESWIRAKDKGAVTYIGSSPNTYWYEDFYWSVGAFPIQDFDSGYVPSFEESSFGALDAPFHTSYVSASGLHFIGNLAVTEAHLQSYDTHSSPLYYWQAYNVLGDPSLVPFLTQADPNTVSHTESIEIGEGTYRVMALPGSYVAISMDNTLHGAALVPATGVVDVPIEPISDWGDVNIVVTRPQTQPYLATVPAIKEGEPFITLTSVTINDENGNANGMADYGEVFSVDVELKNVGDVATAGGLTLSLTGTDPSFTLTSSSTISINSIDAKQSIIVEDAFTFALSNSVTDQYKTEFSLKANDELGEWISTFELTALAPKLELADVELLNVNQDNIDFLNSGEAASLKVFIENIGNSSSKTVLATLQNTSGNVDILTESRSVNTIQPQQIISFTYPIKAASEVPLETIELLLLSVQSGVYGFDSTTNVMVGKYPEFLMGQTDSVKTSLLRFYDSGGENQNYSDNEDYTVTFYPEGEEGEKISVEFVYAIIEGSDSDPYDKLYAYDGINTDAPHFTGSPFSNSEGLNIGTLTATNEYGAITFQFTSDYSVTEKGWEAIVRSIIPEYTATFNVNNSKDEKVENATITIDGLGKSLTTDQSGQATVTLGNGDYSYTVNANSYNAYTSTFQIAGRDTDINIDLVLLNSPTSVERAVGINPNPFNSYLKVDGLELASRLFVTNMLGQIVFEINPVTESSTIIRTDGFKEGIYLLTIVFNDGQVITRKIVKY